ncbi:MAG: bifunctional UDP-N-acetylmuramoyl-tripeptide:D-alanyl-D-alanine ligase/alanine racemase [Sphingobacteriaceae bacterium]|jgi:alanine racemase|nr:bifunctional UDP-N-acetylmuramoyl-tripeptide:D-alanyl-D-alanine ligase/alanine racemase [Sphingobacteriaceae bacterium]
MNQKLYPITEVAQIVKSTGAIAFPDLCIRTLCTDSRKLADMQYGLFFALQGRRDGHEFIADVYKTGIRNFIISKATFDVSTFPGANFLLVEDVLKALQMLAAHHRRQFDIPVIAITGSNGKTIVKEWLYQLLAPEKNIVRSPKSYNSQIGVPLSVWQMNEEHELAIFETGISREGEMEALEEIIQPTIGILTNIGEAHSDGFESKEKKIEEKLKLFKNVELFIYSPHYLEGYPNDIPGESKFTWNQHGTADLEIIDDEVLEEKYQFVRGRFNAEDVQCALPFTDDASVENAICCWATMLAMGYDPDAADDRLEKLAAVKMRLELKNGINNCSIIDDSYSLDISSLAIALDFLKQQNQHVKHTLILSDIPGSVQQPEQVYQQVAELLENKSVERLIGVGKEISLHADKFDVEKQFFESTDELLAGLDELKLSNETILLKGARVFEFERISHALAQKVHETVLSIDLNALEFNLNFYKAQLKPGVKLMAMVKAFSYGSGSFEIANLLQFNKIDYLAVAFADEGVALRKTGITLPIMVMNADSTAFDVITENKLEPEIYSQKILDEFTGVLKFKAIEKYPIHIKLDTGMHRLGFMAEEIDLLIESLTANPVLEIKSVFSHMVASEDPADDDFSRKQISAFESMSGKLAEALGYPFIRHLSNTSGISRWPEAQFDMVRLGIGMYGIDGAYQEKSPLQTVTSLKTSISQIKNLQPGETIGYNRKGVLPNGGKIATVKIGYADGYSRRLGNGVGKMIVNGKLVPTIGNICMDMCMLDITGVRASEGDEVIVFDEQVRVEDIAREIGTIPYEVLTGISQRVKRVYFYE